MQKPKFDFRQVRDHQLQRLRERAGRLANIRDLGSQAHRIRQLQLRGEYLIPIVAFLILASAIFLSRIVPSTGELAEATPAEQVAISSTTAVDDEGLYPGPSVTSDSLEDERTPVPTSADLAASPEVTDTLQLYPGPDDDLPSPIGTPSGTDELPTPVAGGLDPNSDLFPTPDFPTPDFGSGEFPPVDETTDGSEEFPPVDDTTGGGDQLPPEDDGTYPAPEDFPTDEAFDPDAGGGSTEPDPGSSPPPPVFPTALPPVVPIQPAPSVRTPVSRPPAGITTAPTRTPTEEPFEEPFEEFPIDDGTGEAPIDDGTGEAPIDDGTDTGYPVPDDPDLEIDPGLEEDPGLSQPPTATRQPTRPGVPTPTVRPGAPTPDPLEDPTFPEEATEEPAEATEAPVPEEPTAPPTATVPPTPTATPAPTATPTPPPTPTPDPIIRIEGNTRWTAAQSPILIERDHVLVTGASLQIEPGVEVRFKPGANIYIEGQLSSTGNAGAPVRFAGPEGRWGALVGQPGSSITLEHTDLRNAGRGGVALSSTGGGLVLRNVRLTDGGGGILTNGAAVDIRGTQITGNDLPSGPAVNITLGSQAPVTLRGNIVGGNQVPSGTPQVRLTVGGGGSGPIDIQGNGFTGGVGPLVELQTASALGGAIRCNGFRGGSVGLQLSSSTPSGAGFSLAIDTNAFEAQSVAGAASTVEMNAASNWWGDPSGPADAERNPQGQGVRVSVRVGFSPALQARPECAPTP